ncbi:VWA domain-containing protein [Actinoplanes sp. NPDC051633]|uniref:vWA domain-containing protein n=1 Tax=Actinoplanes sp. NPDC051633 TaxID=3155670 RepID=UPI00342FE846
MLRKIIVAAAVAAGTVLPVPSAPAAAAPELAPVMVVLDASGSMKEKLPGGGDKMAAARGAVRTLVRQAPDGSRLGLTVYGTGTGNSGPEKATGCKDVKVVTPLGALDRDGLTRTVDEVRPRGYTPIGEALRVAAAALPAEGPRSIVLVSDGEDTCAPPDPCEVAKELARAGVDLHVHTIGFDVGGTARTQLSCVAESTGGTYTDAPDAGTLTGALNRVTQHALRNYDAAGKRITGTPQPDGAPLVTPGAYQDRIAPDQVRYYGVDVPAGHTLYATATYIAPHIREVLTVRIGRYDTAGRECSGWNSNVRGTDEPVTTAALRWAAPGVEEGGGEDDPCKQAGRQLIRVEIEQTGGDAHTDAVTELQFGLEAPLVGDPGPQGVNDTKVAFTAPTGAARPLVGGGSFGSAAEMPGPGAYSDTVVEGEMMFYRVKLNWGQGLAYRVRLGEQRLERGFVSVRTYWYSPSRNQQAWTSDVYDGKADAMPSNAEALASPPVRYLNRELSGANSFVSQAGWYYIAVLAADNNFNEAPLAVPVTIDVSVSGDVATAPGYRAGATETFGDRPADPAASQSATAAPEPRAADGEKTAFERVASNGPLLWVGVPLLLVLIGGLVFVLVQLTRRRS